MRPSEVKQLIIKLLSSARRSDDPRHIYGLTCRQICDQINAFLPPNSDEVQRQVLAKRVGEQIQVLESEFEIVSKGDARRIYQMATPSLIVQRDTPLRAKFVGDRAYFNEVVEALEAKVDRKTWLVDTDSSSCQAREILEARGISVQTEEMLFEFLPNPVLPTKIDLSIAEQLCEEDISTSMEVYVSRRCNFFDMRWINLDEALPSEMSPLHRIKEKSFRVDRSSYVYIWKFADKMYRLKTQQALLAMYRIDLERKGARLLDLDGDIPIDLKKQLPLAYSLLVDRYTDVVAGYSQGRAGNEDFRSKHLRVKFKYKMNFAKLLEGKLGINKPMD